MLEETIYNAFTKIGTIEKRDVLDFLFQNVSNCPSTRENVTRVVEYAIKDRASFGGFVLALREGGRLVGIAVVNQTGMEGSSPKNVLVQIAVDKNYKEKDLFRYLTEKVLLQTDGDLGLQITSDNPAIPHFKTLGFQTDFVVMKMRPFPVPEGKIRSAKSQFI